jgi:hypothetical protein
LTYPRIHRGQRLCCSGVKGRVVVVAGQHHRLYSSRKEYRQDDSPTSYPQGPQTSTSTKSLKATQRQWAMRGGRRAQKVEAGWRQDKTTSSRKMFVVGSRLPGCEWVTRLPQARNNNNHNNNNNNNAESLRQRTFPALTCLACLPAESWRCVVDINKAILFGD